MTDLRIASVDRGTAFDVHINGQPVPAYPGETIAGVLLAAGIRIFRHTIETGAERGQFCGMGVCYDCLVEADDRPFVRACMTKARPGMRISIPDMAGKIES